MKFGIVTQCGLWNYGNHLQNYALQTILREFGEPCTLVNTYDILKKTVLRSYIKLFTGGTRALEAHRTLKFYSFCKKNIKYERLNEAVCAEKYDYAVCGSDQIWAPALAATPYDFAFFMPSGRRISYAASFGVAQIPDEKKEFYKRALAEMKGLSVREKQGAEIIKELTGRESAVLPDPTLLLGKSKWHSVSKKPAYHVPKKFLLTYFLGNVTDEYRRFIDDAARKLNLKVINLELNSPNEYWYKSGPAEFVWLTENCTLMCTDSFHGCVFSIIMGVPFLAFKRRDKNESMYSRIDTLLDIFGLSGRKFENIIEEDIMKTDYVCVPTVMSKEKDKALAYFRQEFEIEQGNNF